MKKLRAFLADRFANSIVEYGLIATGILVAIIVLMRSIDTN